jgi:phosphoglycolate phosphatase
MVGNIRAALFDFDGTLADSFAAIAASTNHVRMSHGLTPMAEAEVRRYVGFGLAHLMGQLVPGIPPAQAVAEYRAHHEKIATTHTTLLPGVAQTIASLHARGVPLGVCSNKAVYFTKSLVAHLFPPQTFQAVLGPEDVKAPKPDPAMLLEGCRRLKVSEKNTVYVGDMPVDAQAARAAGMECWLVLGGAADEATLRACSADKILTNFQDINSLFSEFPDPNLG